MLINCPRCGFQQPKDQYCAQCGVDIENFKKPTTPILEKIFKNPLLQFSVLLLMTSALAIFVYKTRQESQFPASAVLRSTLQVKSAQNQGATTLSTPSENFSANSDNSTTPMNQPMAASGDIKDAKGPESFTKNGTSTLNKEKSNLNTKENRRLASLQSPQMIVTYAEVDRTQLNSLFELSQGTGQFMTFKDYSAGILPGIASKVRSPSIKILNKEVRNLDSSKTLQWFYGLKDRQNPAIEIGITTFIELSEMDATNLRGNVEIQRNWREQTTPGTFEVQRKSFPAIFEISSETGFFISGIMPVQSYLENDDDLAAINVFKILHSAQFRSGDSDFVIFIEFLPVLK